LCDNDSRVKMFLFHRTPEAPTPKKVIGEEKMQENDDSKVPERDLFYFIFLLL